MIYLPERIYRKFEKGIVPLLRALHHLDLPTHESCYGHLKPIDRSPFPNIYINGSSSLFDPNTLLKLIEILIIWNKRKERKRQWIIVDVVMNDGYYPSRLFLLRPFGENENRSSIALSCFRKDAADLADFIQQACKEPT
jgi:hypothetical protein